MDKYNSFNLKETSGYMYQLLMICTMHFYVESGWMWVCACPNFRIVYGCACMTVSVHMYACEFFKISKVICATAPSSCMKILISTFPYYTVPLTSSL